jgi:hypothetical protein
MRRRHGGGGRRHKRGEEKKRSTTRACRSASADHCRPASATPPSAPTSATGRRLQVRGNPNRTSPPFIRWRMGRLGQPGLGGHSQAGRPTGRTAPPFPEVRRTPLNFRKVQKKPLNFNLALRLLSFIYSDLLVLYIYNLDLKIVL